VKIYERKKKSERKAVIHRKIRKRKEIRDKKEESNEVIHKLKKRERTKHCVKNKVKKNFMNEGKNKIK
jgi:hypothetical protein